jgi:hypothetical protein
MKENKPDPFDLDAEAKKAPFFTLDTPWLKTFLDNNPDVAPKMKKLLQQDYIKYAFNTTCGRIQSGRMVRAHVVLA